MSTVRIVSAKNESIIVTINKATQEIIRVANESGFPIKSTKVLSESPNSPVTIFTDIESKDDLDFFKEVLINGSETVSQEDEHIPYLESDPRIINAVNHETKSGFYSEKNESGNYIIYSVLNGETNYKIEIINENTPLESITYLNQVIENLSLTRDFISSMFLVSPPTFNGATDIPFLPVPEQQPIDTSPLDRAIGKLEKGHQVGRGLPKHELRNGYFLLTTDDAEEGVEPLLIKIIGDSERLHDMGYLELIRQRYASEVDLLTYGRYRMLKLKGKTKSSYMTILRSILVDAAIAGQYKIERMEYTEELGDTKALFL